MNKRSKTATLICALLLVTTLLNGCTQSATAPASQQAAGNSPGNIVNGAVVAQKDGWIYYALYSDKDYGYHQFKVRTDGTGKTEIGLGSFTGINIVGDWIYDAQGGIYKMHTDGTEKTQLNKVTPTIQDINVVGDWIYYIKGSPYGFICRIRTDGTEDKQLSDAKVAYMTVVDGWIYYGNIGLNKMRTDGTGKTFLNDSDGMYINVVGDWIYYESGLALYKIKTDGTGKTKLDDRACWINVSGDWIYYSGDDNYLYKIRTDGTGKTRLNSVVSWQINVVGDWIYYGNHGDGKITNTVYTYKIRTDGTDDQKVQ